MFLAHVGLIICCYAPEQADEDLSHADLPAARLTSLNARILLVNLLIRPSLHRPRALLSPMRPHVHERYAQGRERAWRRSGAASVFCNRFSAAATSS